jgi:hypothetical protein
MKYFITLVLLFNIASNAFGVAWSGNGWIGISIYAVFSMVLVFWVHLSKNGWNALV